MVCYDLGWWLGAGLVSGACGCLSLRVRLDVFAFAVWLLFVYGVLVLIVFCVNDALAIMLVLWLFGLLLC